jgi:hypothetical protein
MKRYRIKTEIALGFLTPQDQYDAIFTWWDGELESDGSTIWLVKGDGTRHESITMAYAIDVWLKEGRIEEIAC